MPQLPKVRDLKEACIRKSENMKCGAHKLDHTKEETCRYYLKCSNCNESHRVDLILGEKYPKN